MHGNAQGHALSVQNTLRRYGPMTFDTLVQRTGLDAPQVRAGLRSSRRTLNPVALTNEIVCTAKMAGGPPVYYLASTDHEAKDYETQRRVIALGHIQSVILLEEKRYDKWPDPQRQAAIKMLGMAHQLLATAP